MEVKASARFVKGSAQKYRLILELIKGKGAGEAMAVLENLPSPKARIVWKVLKSAMANAENNYNLDPSNMRVIKAFADEGPRLLRFRPKARGRVNPIRKRYSHITIVLGE